MQSSSRLRSKYPQALAKCLPEAKAYGNCVVTSIELKPKECDSEFKALSRCFEKAMKGGKLVK